MTYVHSSIYFNFYMAYNTQCNVNSNSCYISYCLGNNNKEESLYLFSTEATSLLVLSK
jgi:hypothetical protein